MSAATTVDVESLAAAGAEATAQAAQALSSRGTSDYETILFTGCVGMLAMFVVGKVGGLQGLLGLIGLGPKSENKAAAESKPQQPEGSKTTTSTEAPEWPAKRHFPADAHPTDN